LLVYFMAIWYIVWPFGIFCGHSVYFMVTWYVFPRFGMLYHEKSGNPGSIVAFVSTLSIREDVFCVRQLLNASLVLQSILINFGRNFLPLRRLVE
jgi:hypothetical protein